MSIECYMRRCPEHPQDEPFCGLSECVASEEAMKEYRELRKQELNHQPETKNEP